MAEMKQRSRVPWQNFIYLPRVKDSFYFPSVLCQQRFDKKSPARLQIRSSHSHFFVFKLCETGNRNAFAISDNKFLTVDPLGLHLEGLGHGVSAAVDGLPVLEVGPVEELFLDLAIAASGSLDGTLVLTRSWKRNK